MIDEKELREILQRRASTTLASGPTDLAKVVRRGRHRQLLTGSVSVVVVIGLAIGAFSGLRALDDSSRPIPAIEPSPTIEPSPSVEPSIEPSVSPELEVWPYKGYPKLVPRSEVPAGLIEGTPGKQFIAVAPGVWQQYEGGGNIMDQARRGQAFLVGHCEALNRYMQFQRDSLETNPFPGTACD